MSVDKCPICSGDRNADTASVRKAVHEAGLKRERVDPGGRVLTFYDGGELRLSDQCNTCDSKEILHFLAVRG